MTALILFVALFLAGSSATRAQESSPSVSLTPDDSEIPKGYEVGDDTVSPDGRFAILYPLKAPLDENGNEPNHPNYPPNVLVRLKPYAVLATVEEDGLPLGVTTGLYAQWNGNSTVAIWEYRRWGIVDLSVYEIENDKLKRVEPVWREALKIFQRDFKGRFLKKYPKEYDSFVIVSEHEEERGKGDFQFKGRKLVLNLHADNKPNGAAGPHWTADLRAAWDLEAAKFDKVDFRPGKISVRGPP